MKKILYCIGLAGVLVICALSLFGWELLRYGERPAKPEDTPQLILILPGQDFVATVDTLSAQQIIQNPHKFKLYARVKGYDKRIQAGEYQLSAAMPPRAILSKLASGKVYLHRLTVPEGQSLKQIAALVEQAGLGDQDEFLQTASDPEFIQTLGIETDSLEGYLFPETYFFPRGVPARKIIRTMFQRFKEVFKAEWHERMRALGMSTHDIVTLASIIEKETGAAEERKLISSVFYNRLKKGMRLESDPTVIYGIEDFDGNITKAHLKTPTPYNTYQIKGLPPGPIASPGLKSLEAALYPDETSYLYFVSKGDSTHVFSKSLKEHNRAVRKYQLKK